MNIPIAFIEVFLTGVVALQGWALIELINLKVQVNTLKQQIEDLRYNK